MSEVEAKNLEGPLVRDLSIEFERLCATWDEGASDMMMNGFINSSLNRGLMGIQNRELVVSAQQDLRSEIQAFFDNVLAKANQTTSPQELGPGSDAGMASAGVATRSRTKEAGLCPKEVRTAGEYRVELVPEKENVADLDRTDLIESSDDEIVLPPDIDFENIPVPQTTTDSEDRIHDPDQTLRQALGDQKSRGEVSSQHSEATPPRKDSDLQGQSSDQKDSGGYGAIAPANAENQGDSGSQTLPFPGKADAALSGTISSPHLKTDGKMTSMSPTGLMSLRDEVPHLAMEKTTPERSGESGGKYLSSGRSRAGGVDPEDQEKAQMAMKSGNVSSLPPTFSPSDNDEAWRGVTRTAIFRDLDEICGNERPLSGDEDEKFARVQRRALASCDGNKERENWICFNWKAWVLVHVEKYGLVDEVKFEDVNGIPRRSMEFGVSVGGEPTATTRHSKATNSSTQVPHRRPGIDDRRCPREPYSVIDDRRCYRGTLGDDFDSSSPGQRRGGPSSLGTLNNPAGGGTRGGSETQQPAHHMNQPPYGPPNEAFGCFDPRYARVGDDPGRVGNDPGDSGSYVQLRDPMDSGRGRGAQPPVFDASLMRFMAKQSDHFRDQWSHEHDRGRDLEIEMEKMRLQLHHLGADLESERQRSREEKERLETRVLEVRKQTELEAQVLVAQAKSDGRREARASMGMRGGPGGGGAANPATPAFGNVDPSRGAQTPKLVRPDLSFPLTPEPLVSSTPSVAEQGRVREGLLKKEDGAPARRQQPAAGVDLQQYGTYLDSSNYQRPHHSSSQDSRLTYSQTQAGLAEEATWLALERQGLKDRGPAHDPGTGGTRSQSTGSGKDDQRGRDDDKANDRDESGKKPPDPGKPPGKSPGSSPPDEGAPGKDENRPPSRRRNHGGGGGGGGGSSSDGEDENSDDEDERDREKRERRLREKSSREKRGRLSYSDVCKTLPMFGSSTKQRTWDQYLVKFTKLVNENHIHEDDRAGILFQKLEGAAEDAVGDLTSEEQNDLAKLVNCLNKTFERPQDSEDASVLLEQRRQMTGETIANFCAAISELARKAYPIDRVERKRALRRRLHYGLADPTMRTRFMDHCVEKLEWTVEDHMSDLRKNDPLRVMGGCAKDGTPMLRVQEEQNLASVGGAGASNQPGSLAPAAVNAVGTPGQQFRGGFGGGRGGGRFRNKNKNRGRGGFRGGFGGTNASGEDRQQAGKDTGYQRDSQASANDREWSARTSSNTSRPGGYGKGGGQSGKPSSAGRGRGVPRDSDVCFECGERGHWARNHRNEEMMTFYCHCRNKSRPVGNQPDEEAYTPTQETGNGWADT